MPQMSPLLWLNLYVYITVVFLLILMLNFFIKPPIKMKVTSKQSNLKHLNWKW